MFHVGQKVVCVDDKPEQDCADWEECERIVDGEIYTITSVHDHDGCVVLWLNEVHRCIEASIEHGPEVGYGARRFRPVVEKKTSIAVFQEILNKVNGGMEKVE